MIKRVGMGMLVIAGAALAGCSADPNGSSEPESATSSEALVTQSQVPGAYRADTKHVAIVTCSTLCSVRYEDRTASASLVVNADGTFTCSGSDCIATAGTWAFPTSGDWRYLTFTPYGAKVGEWTAGQATLTVYGPARRNVSGTYTQNVHFIHR